MRPRQLTIKEWTQLKASTHWGVIKTAVSYTTPHVVPHQALTARICQEFLQLSQGETNNSISRNGKTKQSSPEKWPIQGCDVGNSEWLWSILWFQKVRLDSEWAGVSQRNTGQNEKAPLGSQSWKHIHHVVDRWTGWRNCGPSYNSTLLSNKKEKLLVHTMENLKTECSACAVQFHIGKILENVK